VVSPELVRAVKYAQAACHQDERGAEGEKRALWRTAGERIESRRSACADPHLGDRKEHDRCDCHDGAEADSVDSTLATGGAAVAQAFCGAVHG
jgi:hypothetical protein